MQNTENFRLKKLLNLSNDQKSEKYSVLSNKMDQLKAEYFSQKDESSYKKSLNNILLKIIISGNILILVGIFIILSNKKTRKNIRVKIKNVINQF